MRPGQGEESLCPQPRTLACHQGVSYGRLMDVIRVHPALFPELYLLRFPVGQAISGVTVTR